ncbi:Ammonium transporter [Parasponia andersonii]|uniref:Ammonium transporter n=1 Tax=Parasponia andersonii TaxID=3476 RepID=A0A2P5B122_PARAD|nr:Ammonium transporter [Parasponia andersonii]
MLFWQSIIAVGPIPEPRTVRRVTRIARDPDIGIWRSEAPRVCCLGTATLASTVVGIRSPKDLQTPRVCCLGTATLASTVVGIRSPKGLQLDAMGDSPTAPDPDRAFNAFLGRRRRKSGGGSTEEVTEIPAHDGLKRSGSERLGYYQQGIVPAVPGWLNKGDNTWQMVSAALVGMQGMPGLVILYAGLLKKK